MIKMDHDRLTKQIFLLNISLNHSNWYTDFCDVCVECGFEHVCTNLCEISLDQVGSKLKSVQEEVWQAAIQVKPKLRTYTKFKENLVCENCILEIGPKYRRSILSQFRCGILPLHIETGRYRNVPAEDRNCTFCPQDIENEFHFMCICPSYSDIRKTLFTNVTQSSPGFLDLTIEEKFIEIMKNHQLAAAKYLKSAWEIRRAAIYNYVSYFLGVRTGTYR